MEAEMTINKRFFALAVCGVLIISSASLSAQMSPIIVSDSVLAYSTYFGGEGDDSATRVGVDAGGNTYIVGTRPSATGRDSDAFVAKFSPAGALLWVTNVGDRCDDVGRGIAVDAQGNAYVTGRIGGICFPYPDLTPGAFVAKLDATGTVRYLFAFSGKFSYSDIGQAVAVDADGNAYVTGLNSSGLFPTTPGAFQQNYGGGTADGFVAKVNAAGTALVYATYLGGSGHESPNGIAVSPEGGGYVVYVTGSTESHDFPTTPNAFQTENHGLGPVTTNAFVTKVNVDGSALVYSTYLGGRFDDGAGGIAVDAVGNAFVAGWAESDNFPTTPGVVQPNPGDDRLCSFRLCTDAFVTKLDASGSALLYSTYLGGNLFDGGTAIALDGDGNAYVTGYTDSLDFPTSGAFQPNRGGGQDAFVAKLDSTASTLIYSSYLGGSGQEAGNGIAVDGAGTAHVTGATTSQDFPTTPDAYQPNPGGGYCGPFGPCADAFVTRISVR
jgi:hypothetical protein